MLEYVPSAHIYRCTRSPHPSPSVLCCGVQNGQLGNEEACGEHNGVLGFSGLDEGLAHGADSTLRVQQLAN
jgi:hypothetical protein